MTPAEPPRRILLTGGRAPATLELARALADSGHTVFMAESYPWHVCRGSRAIQRNFSAPAPRIDLEAYMREMIGIIRREKIGLLIPTCEEIFHIARNLDALTAECDVFCEPLDRLAPLHDKWRFIQIVSGMRLDAPETRVIRAGEDPRSAIETWRRDFEERPFVLKPVYSRFAARILFFTDNKKHPFLPVAFADDWLIQEFVAGEQFSTFAIAHRGKLAAHTIYPRGFTAGPGASIEFQHVDHPAIERWVRQFVATFKFTGQIAFDFVVDCSGRAIPLECNPRLTSGIHLLAIPRAIDRAYFGTSSQMLTPRVGTSRMIGLAMLTYGLKTAWVQKKSLNWRARWKSSKDVIFRVTDPMPLFMQGASLAGMAARALRNRTTILEASTCDIEWNGEPPPLSPLAARMDRIYRFERHIFDLTRPFYLIGRDKALRSIRPAPGDHVLEIGVGTARNLLKLFARTPTAHFYGVDVSKMMLEVARKKVNARRAPIRLALADEHTTDYQKIFNLPHGYDRIFCSFCLSMLPDPVPVVAAAIDNLKPGGSFFIVDYFDRRAFPRWLDRLIAASMRPYGVAFSTAPIDYLASLSGTLTLHPGAFRFSYILCYDKPLPSISYSQSHEFTPA